eukprot:Transcript_26189.p1 GENE.Transcript_26189~~Transcript_26189.p1  ORF type:complete len:649 (-),score=78.29 Transcript_26189:74-2020(-)
MAEEMARKEAATSAQMEEEARQQQAQSATAQPHRRPAGKAVRPGAAGKQSARQSGQSRSEAGSSIAHASRDSVVGPKAPAPRSFKEPIPCPKRERSDGFSSRLFRDDAQRERNEERRSNREEECIEVSRRSSNANLSSSSHSENSNTPALRNGRGGGGGRGTGPVAAARRGQEAAARPRDQERFAKRWGPLRKHVRLRVPTKEFGVPGGQYYDAVVQEVFKPGWCTIKERRQYFEHGYVDLHFPIDQEVVTYDVHVAVQWYEDPNAVRAPDPQICERLLSDDEDECAKCGEGGQLVGCEGTDCNRWFHVRCQPKSDPFPHLDGPAWYCEECLGAEWAPSQGERRLVSNLKGTHITNATCFMCERPLGADRHDKDIFKRAHFEPRCTGGSQCPAFTMDTESDMVMCTDGRVIFTARGMGAPQPAALGQRDEPDVQEVPVHETPQIFGGPSSVEGVRFFNDAASHSFHHGAGATVQQQQPSAEDRAAVDAARDLQSLIHSFSNSDEYHAARRAREAREAEVAAMDEEQRQELNRRAMVDIEVRHTGRSTEGWNREGETPGMAHYRAVAGILFSSNGHAPAPAPAVAAVQPGHEVVSAALLQAATDFRAPVPTPVPAPEPAPAPAPIPSRYQLWDGPEIQDGSDTDDPDDM